MAASAEHQQVHSQDPSAGWSDVVLGSMLSWRPCHGWVDGASTWVDGWVVDARRSSGDGSRPCVDVAATGDPDADPAWHAAAMKAWASGRVLCVSPYEACPNVLALIVPNATLDTATILEALHRWRP